MKGLAQFIESVLQDTLNTHNEIFVGKLSKKHARIIYDCIGVRYKKIPKIIDSSAIRHIVRKHGTVKEVKMGQIRVEKKDLFLITQIIGEPDEIIYKGKNSQKQDVFCFNRNLGDLYICAMTIRISKNGAKLVLSSMYIQKRKKPVS